MTFLAAVRRTFARGDVPLRQHSPAARRTDNTAGPCRSTWPPCPRSVTRLLRPGAAGRMQFPAGGGASAVRVAARQRRIAQPLRRVPLLLEHGVVLRSAAQVFVSARRVHSRPLGVSVSVLDKAVKATRKAATVETTLHPHWVVETAAFGRACPVTA